MVTGRKGHDTLSTLSPVECRDGIEGAPKLEGSNALEVLAFKEQRGAQPLVHRARRHHRCAVGGAGDPRGGAFHRGIVGQRLMWE